MQLFHFLLTNNLRGNIRYERFEEGTNATRDSIQNKLICFATEQFFSLNILTNTAPAKTTLVFGLVK